MELKSPKILPNDKAAAVLEKMRFEEKKYDDEALQMFKDHPADPIPWAMVDKSWIKLPQKQVGGAGDYTLESFKQVFDGYLNHYCSHYQTDNFERLFQNKMQTLNEIKANIMLKLEAANAERQEA